MSDVGKKIIASWFVAAALTSSLYGANESFNDPFFNDPFGDDIFKEMMQLQRQMDKMFEKMQKHIKERTMQGIGSVKRFSYAAKTGIVDKGDHYEVLTSIPKSSESHIDIKTENGMLLVSAKIVEEKEKRLDGGIQKFRSARVYQNAFSLPKDADISSIRSAFKEGVLVIYIDKKKGGVAPNKSKKKTLENATKDQENKPLYIKSDVPTMD